MSQLKQFKLLSEYNQLMNQRLYEAVTKLPDEKIKEDKGAFFKSVLGTLNHILVGDIIWLRRFSLNPANQDALLYFSNIQKPQSLNSVIFTDFNELKEERKKVDDLIIKWIESLSEKDLDSNISYKNMNGNVFEKDFSSLINHLFLHQVHHRGQATTLLSQFGLDFGETDLIEIIK
jgi:uncharacterized damage-inducible protein DinB